MEEIFVERMYKKYNKSKKFINLLLQICEDNCILNKEKIVDEVCQKVCQSKKAKDAKHTTKRVLRKAIT